MNISIIQKSPPIIDGTMQPPEMHIIDAYDQIFYLPFINKWVIDPYFYRLCKCSLKEGSFLIVECRNDKFYVIADLEGDIDQLTIPEWKKEN